MTHKELIEALKSICEQLAILHDALAMYSEETVLVKYEHQSYGYWKDKDGNLVLGTIPHTKTDPSPESLDAASKE